MTRVFIVEDHPFVRQALDELLCQEPDLTVCGLAATAEAALDEAPDARPDLMLVDVSLPDMSGIDLVRQLRTSMPGLRIVMLSGHSERSYIDQALEAGAAGYILKGYATEIPVAIRTVVGGKPFLSAVLGGPARKP